jgi:hypothetical protein
MTANTSPGRDSSRGSHPTEPIRIIAGSGRSGTTWVLDALAEANGLRTVFEPLHPLAIPDARPYAYRYLRPQTEHAAAEAFFSDVFAGRRHSSWTSYRVRPDRLRLSASTFRSIASLHSYVRRWQALYERYHRYAPAKHRVPLVKFIRANLLLGWILERFDARVVLVLRHPGAVVESRLRLEGDEWEPRAQLLQYLGQPELQEDYLFKYNELLRGPLSLAEAHTVIWCIENQLALQQLAASCTLIAHYEHLVTEGPAAWHPLVEALALRGMPEPDVLMRPSQSAAHRGEHRAHGAADIARWRDALDSPTRRQIARVLDAMEVTLYDMDDPMPRASVRPVESFGRPVNA